MIELRTIIGQGRKRVGFLVGAGAPAGLRSEANTPLIPAVAELTEQVLAVVGEDYGDTIKAIRDRNPEFNIEKILSRTRSLGEVIGEAEVDGLTGVDYLALSEAICREIGRIVDVRLPLGDTPYRDLVNWITGTTRRHPVELFTTNYDRLFEETFEQLKAPYFDGFSGSREPFFDSVSVSNDDLPARWTRLWKLHGSLGWRANDQGETIRSADSSATHMIYPEHAKFNRTQKAPYTSLFDRLQTFLKSDDALLVVTGFSFNDEHIVAKISEALAANPNASVFAFQFNRIEQELAALEIAKSRPNLSLYARDRAVIGGVDGNWVVGDPPSRDWGPIRASFWGSGDEDVPNEFLLGDFTRLARFFALARASNLRDQRATHETEPSTDA